MSNYITVDGGTTNTRLRLVKNHSIVAEVRVSMGAKDCIFENNVYKNLLTEKIKELLMEAKTEESEIRAVIISGMLTSELGLYNVPHVSAPVGIRELHHAMRCEKIGICSIPCYFIPGVKIVSENIWQSDMMRGEETEFFGLSERLGNSSVCIMPGSHSKHIFSDSEKKISSFCTFLSGEMLSALSRNTILSSSVDISIPDFDAESLLLGYDVASELGINRALFQTRVLDKMLGKTAKDIYSYFLGAVLCEEVKTLAGCEREIYVCGRRNIRKGMIYLLKHRLSLSATEISDRESEFAAVRGAIRIFEYKEDDNGYGSTEGN